MTCERLKADDVAVMVTMGSLMQVLRQGMQPRGSCWRCKRELS